MTEDNGGPAFQAETAFRFHVGMSLRDWFAGQALAGIARLNGKGSFYSEAYAASWAYQYADAMLKAREVEE